MVYQEHFKHAKRRDAEIFASMAPEIYDAPRSTKIELPDGTRKAIEIMKPVMDEQTGEVVYLNDVRNAEFDVYSKIGPSFSSQKEQTIAALQEMTMNMDPNDPVRKALQLKMLMLMDGVEFDDIREYANKQLVLMGIKSPETEEEQKLLQESQEAQANEEDPALVLAKAEELKGQADMLRETREGTAMQLDDANSKAEIAVKAFKVETERMKLDLESQQAGITIAKASVDIEGIELDNELKFKELMSPEKSGEAAEPT